MNTISTTVSLLAAALLATALAACASDGNRAANGQRRASAIARHPAPPPAPINHIVFITLNDPAQTEALLRDCDRLLAVIPGVIAYAGGAHLDTGRGARVDSDYHVGLYLGFATPADYETYVRHPNHLALLQQWEARLARLRVFDVLDNPG